MKYQAKPDDHLWVTSMGKKFRVRCVTTEIDEANDYMEKHEETALIACFGPFNVIANKYEGIKLTDQE